MSFLHGGPAPALPGISPMRALKESDSTVDNSSMFSTTYLPVIEFSSVCVTSFWEAGAEKSSFSCLDSSVSFFVNRAHVSHTRPAIIINSQQGFLATSVVEACAAKDASLDQSCLQWTWTKETEVVSVLPL